MANPTVTEIDYCRHRGDTFSIQIAIKDSVAAAIDVTGFSFLLTVDPSATPTAAGTNIYQLIGVLDDAVNGLVSFAPDATDALSAPGNYFYDIQQTDAASKIRTIAKGKWTILQDITK